MPYVVTALIGRSGRRSGKRTTSKVFKTKREATKFKNDTAKQRPGSNPRLKKV